MIKQIQTIDDAIEHYRTVSDLYRKEISGDENAGGIEHIVAATRALATEILELRKLKDKPSPTSIVETIFKELGLVRECPEIPE